MNDPKEQIALLKILLEDIQSKLKPWLNKSDRLEIQFQLNAIVKSSDKLTKTDVSVPAELRELKFKLLKELDKFNEAGKLQRELLEILSAFVSTRQTRNKVKKTKTIAKEKVKHSNPQFELVKLINGSLIKPDTVIVKKYKGILYSGVITRDGKIKTAINNIPIFHNSPSAAAVAISQKSQNGWTWWSIEGDVKGRTLDFYRQKYIKNEHETRR